MPKRPFRHLVIFDVETTGFSPRGGDRMIEIAGLKIDVPLIRDPDGRDWICDPKAMKKAGTFCSLLKVDRDIPPGAMMINGITPQMLRRAPRADEVLPDFMNFIENACLIGHNVQFDLSFLTNELSLIGRGMNRTMFLDTVRMARRLLPELGRYSLWFLARALGVDRDQEHRAMSDVEMTYQVFRSLLDIADRRDICTVGDLVGLCGGATPDSSAQASLRGIHR